ncbi:hypothetical protein TSMEX_001418 [Taenia solium]
MGAHPVERLRMRLLLATHQLLRLPRQQRRLDAGQHTNSSWCTRPKGNCRPARANLVFTLAYDLPPLPLPLISLSPSTKRLRRGSAT